MAENTKIQIDRILKSSLIFKVLEGYKYVIKIRPNASSVVSVLKSTDPGPASKNWLIRFDNPHKNVLFPHINLRQKYTGIPDPHLKLPPGALTAAKYTAYAGKVLDSLCYMAIVWDGIRLGQAIHKDFQEGTKHNTVECSSSMFGQWVGGFVANSVGLAVGALVFPGLGPLVCGFSLGILGVKYGGKYAVYTISHWNTKRQHPECIRELSKSKYF